MSRPVYVLQPAFTGGEISDDVASRVDLEKYQLALLNAENAVVRPYGAVKKRTGSAYCGSTKNNGKVVLRKFEFASELAYLLEFGVGYLRIWRQGEYLDVELTTPYTANDLSKIRTVQSVDVMYVCTGTHPVYKLTRFAEDNWTFSEVNWTLPPFMDEPPDEDATVIPLGESGTFNIMATKDIFTAKNIGDYIKAEQLISGAAVSASMTSTSSSYTTNAISSSKGTVKIEKTGASAATVKVQAKVTKVSMSMVKKTKEAWEDVTTISGSSGAWTRNVSIDITRRFINADPDIGYMSGTEDYAGQIRFVITSIDTDAINLKVTNADGKIYDFKNLKNNNLYTGTLRVGEQWKIITHGTWTGTLYLQLSYDEGESWTTIRTYTGAEDFNPSESGTVEDMALIRVQPLISSGTVKIDLSSYAYTNVGYAKITGIVNANTVQVRGIKRFESGKVAKEFYLSAWGKNNGYPYAATFFQDRLVFGGCDKYPQRLWMSKTALYENFEVEKASGTVTDDSAVTADFLSQQPFAVRHLLAANDLVVLTEGNTWTISGSEVVTPSNISPRNQESYGASDVRIMHVGSRTIYTQRRGSAVRDVGYSYDMDSYTGVDLTLLAKHLTRGHKITDGDYAPEPDSVLYYVRDDGVMLCLTYIPEQRVYGWSHFVTDGKYESVCVVSEGDEDRVYVVVKREINSQTVRYLERFVLDHHTDHQQDYRMLDCCRYYSGTATATITGLSHLEGKEVYVMADNYFYDGEKYIVANGQITLPEEVEEALVGLPYSLTIEQPNIEIGNTDTGTMQGRMKNVAAATLRVTRSYGGVIGPMEGGATNRIIMDKERLEKGEDVLYTGDKKVVLGIGGYNAGGRVYIKQTEPFPFNLNALIREVTFSDV